MNRPILLACATLAASLALLSGLAPLSAQAGPEPGVNLLAEPERRQPELGLQGIATPPLRLLEDARLPDDQYQVRIRQRVIVRISPSSPDARQRLAAMQARRSEGRGIREVEHDDCVRVENILGVQPTTDNRLLLFMENRNVLAAALDRQCTAQAFYQGFYVERQDDGRLCVRRDMLQSRAGASCSVENLTRLVPAN